MTQRRIRNTLLFAGSLVGTGLAIGAVGAFMRRDSVAWLYVIGAIGAFVVALAPGRRLRDRISPPD